MRSPASERETARRQYTAVFLALRPPAIGDLHGLHRSEVQLPVLESQVTVENHLDSAAFGQHRIGPARQQNAHETGGGTGGSPDPGAHAIVPGSATGNHSDGSSRGR